MEGLMHETVGEQNEIQLVHGFTMACSYTKCLSGPGRKHLDGYLEGEKKSNIKSIEMRHVVKPEKRKTSSNVSWSCFMHCYERNKEVGSGVSCVKSTNLYCDYFVCSTLKGKRTNRINLN